jgi:protein-disulfide isomerase
MNRRQILLLAGAVSVRPLARNLSPDAAWAASVDINAILHDPDAPETGNAKGDVTIVAFFDYNCPFCKTSEPALDKVVRDDGKIRLVYKDWPILSEASIFGAQMALAAKYQGRYQAAHDALMAIPGRKIPKEQMRDAVAKAGVDMTRLQADLQAQADPITALLRRNLAQADSMGLNGTPVYLVGQFKVAEALDESGFRNAVEQARSRQAAR